MRNIIYLSIAAFVLVLASCKGEAPVDENAIAAQAARESFQLLLDGRYDDYVAAAVSSDSLPADYCRQLADAARQLVADQRRLHQGMHAVSIGRAETDSTMHATLVFLNIAYNDSTTEEIVVPMVKQDGRWRMK